MPAHSPEITLAPTTTLLDLVERQQITTISVVASSTPSGVDSGSNTTEKKPFPVAVAIPALVGGMAAAIGAFGLWWWCSRRSKKERRVRFSSLFFCFPLPSCLCHIISKNGQGLTRRNDGKQLNERNNAPGLIRLVDLL